jgi:benzoyl-CoA reductase/2-hydroxyglutaryl-CoA dehydratase subunit BcrC/BadD/HgdB
MGTPFFPIFMLMLALAGINIAFGYKLGSTPISQEELEQIKDKAFEEAKKDYMNYFHNRFDPQALALSNVYVQRLQSENDELLKRNKELTEELKKERKKNESIGSN